MVQPWFPRDPRDPSRLTVQGEMIGRNFPSPEVAERSLEQYSTAVLEHSLAPPPLPKAEFRQAMQERRSGEEMHGGTMVFWGWRLFDQRG